MRWFLKLMAVLSMVVLFYTINSVQAATAQRELLDQTVAVVNNEVITQSQYDQALRQVLRQWSPNAPRPAPTTLRMQVLTQMINQKLMLQLAKHNQMSASSAQVDQAIASILAKNHFTLPALQQKLKQEGYSYAQFRSDLADQITVHQLQTAVIKQREIHISEAELEQFKSQYASQLKTNLQYHVLDILIPLPDEPSPEQKNQAKEKAQTIMTAIKKGIPPHQVAEGQDNDLGWHSLADLPDIFAPTLQHLSPHAASNPIIAQNGIHILVLLGTRSDSGSGLNSTQVKNLVYQEKVAKILENWLDEIKKNSNIKIYFTP